MSVVESVAQDYRMTCQRCRREWTATYEVVAYHDLDGDHELYRLNGAPAVPPWAGVACPFCAGQRVRVLPARRSREP